jgi:hypothetical protein
LLLLEKLLLLLGILLFVHLRGLWILLLLLRQFC